MAPAPSAAARYLGQVEWAWSPMHSRIDADHPSPDRSRDGEYVDRCHWIAQTGVLEVRALSGVARAVWDTPRGSTAGPQAVRGASSYPSPLPRSRPLRMDHRS
jgi:hypothetical protein